MPSLLDLPPELIHHVYEFADSSAVCRLRLTSRTLWKLGDEHLLPEITVYYHRHSIDTIEQIASCRPAIRTAIKSLFFQADETDSQVGAPSTGVLKQFHHWNVARHFDYARDSPRLMSLLAQRGTLTGAGESSCVHSALVDYQALNWRADQKTSFDAIDELSDDGLNDIPESGGASKDPILWAAFEHHDRLYKDQLEMRTETIVRNNFRTLFRACPNLTKLSVNSNDILGPNRAFQSPEWLRGLRVPHRSFYSEPYVLGELLLAAHDALLNLRDLSLGLVNLLPIISSAPPLMLKAFRKLTRLHWKFEELVSRELGIDDNIDFTVAQFAGSDLEAQLADFLSSCPDLEQLYLDMMYHTLASARANFGLLLPTGSVLKRLRRVRLTNFQARPGRLSAFMLDHAATLQYVHLHNIHLYDFEDENEQGQEQLDENGTYWQACIEAFAGKMTALTKVRLTGRFTSYASNGIWYYGRKSRSSSGEDGHERDSSEVIDFILTGISQYSFPAPSFDGQVVSARLLEELLDDDDDDDGVSSIGTSSLEEQLAAFDERYGPFDSGDDESQGDDEDE